MQAWAAYAALVRIVGKDDPPPPPLTPGEGGGTPKPGRTRSKGDFRGIKFSTQPTTFELILLLTLSPQEWRYSAVIPMRIQHCPATGGMASRTTTMT